MITWTKHELGDLITIKHGFAFLGAHFSDSGSHIVLTPGNFYDKGGFRRRVEKDKWYTGPVPPEYILKKGDLIVAMTEQGEGLLGSTATIPESGLYLHNQRLGLIKIRDPLNATIPFLYYLFNLESVRKQIRGSASGTKVRHTSPGRIYEISATVPDSETQNSIASVLSGYDELIEINQKRIKALEEMAHLLYTEWFVKFNFPGHERVEMVDSSTEYGMIPEGWKAQRLAKVASLVRGCSYSSNEIDDYVGDYYIVNLKSFNRGGGFRFDGAKYYSGVTNDDQLLNAGDVVVAVTDMTNDRAVIARPARVPEIDGKVTLSADVVKINSAMLPNSFVYELLSSYRFTELTKQKANGANVLHLKPAAILEFVALIPDPKSLKQFDTFCGPAIGEVDKLVKQNDVLKKTRDLLIPQLVTGKRVLKV